MVAHGATIAAIFVAILSAFEECTRVADGYELPTPTFQLLQPKGIRVWIPHEEGMKSFAFDGNVNRDITLSMVSADISRIVFQPRGRKWIIQDLNVNVNNGDTINYWMTVDVNGFTYKRKNLTLIHGGRVATILVFNETFDSLNELTWVNVNKIPLSPDFEFCIYDNFGLRSIVANIGDGVLYITPILLDNMFGTGVTEFSQREVEDCTSTIPAECKREAIAFHILPPVVSARFTTKESFNFRYGKIEIRAKFPEGDWLYPEMWLEPKYNNYGAGYSSGRVLLGLARGNDNLINATSGEIFDSRKLEFGFRIGAGGNVENYMVSKIEESGPSWTKDFHVYTTIWNGDGFQFLVDNEKVGKLVPGENGWMKNQFNKVAPFDHEFYITIGLGVGGIRIFPDGTTSSGISKPWKNLGAKAMLQFWRAKYHWFPSWKQQNGNKTAFKIDYIRVWSYD